MGGGTTTDGKVKRFLNVQRDNNNIFIDSLDRLIEGDVLRVLVEGEVHTAVCIDPSEPSFIEEEGNGNFRTIKYSSDAYIEDDAIKGATLCRSYGKKSDVGKIIKYALRASFN